MKINNVKYVQLVAGRILTLAIDKDYVCYLIPNTPESSLSELRQGSPLPHYCQNGFDSFTGDEIREMIPDAIAELNGLPDRGKLLNAVHATVSRLSTIEVGLDNVADGLEGRATLVRNKRDEIIILRQDMVRLNNQLHGLPASEYSELPK